MLVAQCNGEPRSRNFREIDALDPPKDLGQGFFLDEQVHDYLAFTFTHSNVLCASTTTAE